MIRGGGGRQNLIAEGKKVLERVALPCNILLLLLSFNISVVICVRCIRISHKQLK